ncbi:MAG: histidine phosphatase family protein [Bacteroidaceae bacterium]|nr:histidine phosphatase family protein [Bacteroidaceae bacterium]
MITLYLCRHGRTIENEQRMLQGQSPDYGRLSETGKAQAAAMGEKLRGIKADAIITSDLQRCIDTAHIALGDDVELIKEPLLRERDWTTMVGHPIAEGMLQEEKYAESVESMAKRAEALLKKWKKEYDGKTIIAIGHGFIDRVLQGVYYGKNYLEIKPMENSEVREILINVT